jgi:glycosyltransferase involved in cell wall biosynthesis
VKTRTAVDLPLRVMLAGNNFSFPEGLGATARVRAVGSGLVRAGAQVEVMATSYSLQAGDGASSWQVSGWIDGMHYTHSMGTMLPSQSRIARRWERMAAVGRASLLAGGLGGPEPDAVLFFTNDSFALPLALGGAARLRRSVLLLDGCELPFVYREKTVGTRMAATAYTRGLLRWYDGILAISRYLEHYYRGRVGPGTAIVHVPILVDCERFERPVGTRTSVDMPYVGYSGSLAPSKGVATLLKAFRIVASRHPEITLRLSGVAVPRSYRAELERLVSDLDLSGRVHFLGLIPAADVPGFFQEAVALVVPHPAADFSEAAFPTKLGEYLASGTPVVATRVGEIEQYLTDGESALLTDPGCENTLAEALELLLGDPERARLIGGRGAAVARREFDVGRQGRRLYEFMSDLHARKTWKRERFQ